MPLARGECLVYQVKLCLGKGLTCSKPPQSNKKQVLKPLSSSVGVLWSLVRLLGGGIAMTGLPAGATFLLLQPGHWPFAGLENLPFGKAFS